MDFSEGQPIYPVLAEQLQDLNIGILSKCTSFVNILVIFSQKFHFLVNNVGLGYQGPKLLDELSADVSIFRRIFNLFNDTEFQLS